MNRPQHATFTVNGKVCIDVTSPLVFSVSDTQQPHWPELREAMLDNIRDSYRMLIDEALAQEGHRP